MNAYQTPDWIRAVGDAAMVLGFLTAFVVALVAVARFLIVRPLMRMIDDRTKQIQPNTNGGRSLSDLHVKVDGLGVRMSRVERELLRIDEELEDIVGD